MLALARKVNESIMLVSFDFITPIIEPMIVPAIEIKATIIVLSIIFIFTPLAYNIFIILKKYLIIYIR